MTRRAAGGLGALAAALLWSAALGCASTIPSDDPVEPQAAPPPAPSPAAPAVAADPRSQSQPGEAIEWERDAERAFARARRQQRLLLVFVHADWNVDSLRAAREVLSDPRVARASRLLVPLWLDVTAADGAAEAQLARVDVARPPALVVVDANGKRVDELEGTMTVDGVLELLARTARR